MILTGARCDLDEIAHRILSRQRSELPDIRFRLLQSFDGFCTVIMRISFLFRSGQPRRNDDALALQIRVDPFWPELTSPARMPMPAEGAAEIQNALGVDTDRAA